MPETRDLPVKLTDDEIAQRGVELANAVTAHASVIEQAKIGRAAIKARVDEAMATVRRLASAVERGFELRPISVTTSFDRTSGRVIVLRDDTSLVVESRPMSAREMQDLDQGKLFGPEATPESIAFADALDETARRAKARADFSLASWASDRLTSEQVEKLVAAGFGEVSSLLEARVDQIVDAGDIDPDIAQDMHDDLVAEYELVQAAPAAGRTLDLDGAAEGALAAAAAS